jgi:crotonobetainyl-CoA:carnitine CoA-transferase CaiB-like acyl-CoA transferase
MEPLNGIRVLDFTRVIAGPFCTMMLGDLGAEIIKIEPPPSGDDARNVGPPFVEGESVYFMSFNRNKKSLVLDLKTPEGKALIHRLAEKADVTVENFRPGTGSKLGIDYPTLKEINPRIICCSISAFGHTGPLSNDPGYDITIQAMSGSMSITGEPDRPPVKIGIPLGDTAGGMYAAYAIISALYARERTGRGQAIDIALYDALVAQLSYHAGYCLMAGVIPEPQGTGHPNRVPYQAFKTKDISIIVAIFTEEFWQKFCPLIGKEELIRDPRFKDNAGRVKYRHVLIPILEKVFETKTGDEWLAILKGIPSAPLNTIDRALSHPQTLARQMVESISHPQCGDISVLGNPVKLSDMRAFSFKPPPLLGQHTEEILQGYMGYSPEAIADLAKRGIIKTL